VTSVAHGARPRRARTTFRPARTGSRRRTFVLAGGVVWIAAFAVLLAGVVAINVAVLRLNLELNQAGRDRTELQADNSLLRSELSSSATTAHIERLARGELGMVPANPDGTVYVHLAP
jgi:cell division protein FtsL